eukprot:NODE_4281_length_325_cov_33.181159_g4199_i0.p1 GENE.NODE_4281_length_325_cov_33.181159_g4199_i0~~NODE_4281_length_325_cov_33.181159_g4199_i0.p1  ORF type:complete len:63 (+),score=11.15 NODE_4281_length_325_cov_33.181159_g4199_i0:58-246(+)
MNEEVVQRLYQVTGILKQVVRVGFIPAIIYMGVRKGPDPEMGEPFNFITVLLPFLAPAFQSA